MKGRVLLRELASWVQSTCLASDTAVIIFRNKGTISTIPWEWAYSREGWGWLRRPQHKKAHQLFNTCGKIETLNPENPLWFWSGLRHNLVRLLWVFPQLLSFPVCKMHLWMKIICEIPLFFRTLWRQLANQYASHPSGCIYYYIFVWLWIEKGSNYFHANE